MGRRAQWPPLPYDEWAEVYSTLHLWTQIVGKIRLTQMPWTNHSWHVALAVSARGLTTGAMPHGAQSFQIDFDFLDHRLLVSTSAGEARALELRPRSVADFYGELMGHLAQLGLPVSIHTMPNEIEGAIPFPEDNTHAAYEAEAVERFWRVLAQSDRLLQQFRAAFTGKCSPVHFFWGSFDLAVTRFSGRPAPPHRGGIPNLPDWVTREAYSHEVSSAGFWPGGAAHPFPFFYSYAYPEPEGFSAVTLPVEGAYYSHDLGEFILPYDVVREATSPDEVVLAFLQSSYEATATLGAWDRAALERPVGWHPAPSSG